MIRIETSERRDLVTLALSGRIQAEDLPELKRVMESYSKPLVLDLKGVKLIDREAVTFLANLETDNATITNCPPYIREWIRRRTGPTVEAKAAVFSDRDIDRPTQTIINA